MIRVARNPFYISFPEMKAVFEGPVGNFETNEFAVVHKIPLVQQIRGMPCSGQA